MRMNNTIQKLNDEYERCMEMLNKLKYDPFAYVNIRNADYWDGKIAGLKIALSMIETMVGVSTTPY